MLQDNDKSLIKNRTIKKQWFIIEINLNSSEIYIDIMSKSTTCNIIFFSFVSNMTRVIGLLITLVLKVFFHFLINFRDLFEF